MNAVVCERTGVYSQRSEPLDRLWIDAGGGKEERERKRNRELMKYNYSRRKKEKEFTLGESMEKAKQTFVFTRMEDDTSAAGVN